MIDALLRAVLTKVEYEVPHDGEPPPDPLLNDVDCNVWNGLLEFSVVENGSYAAAVPFINLNMTYGGTATPGILVYDGLGGYCGGGPPATCNIRATFSGLDSLGNPVLGTTTTSIAFPSTAPPHPPPVDIVVVVSADNPVRGRRARLWLYFGVGTMC